MMSERLRHWLCLLALIEAAMPSSNFFTAADGRAVAAVDPGEQCSGIIMKHVKVVQENKELEGKHAIFVKEKKELEGKHATVVNEKKELDGKYAKKVAMHAEDIQENDEYRSQVYETRQELARLRSKKKASLGEDDHPLQTSTPLLRESAGASRAGKTSCAKWISQYQYGSRRRCAWRSEEAFAVGGKLRYMSFGSTQVYNKHGRRRNYVWTCGCREVTCHTHGRDHEWVARFKKCHTKTYILETNNNYHYKGGVNHHRRRSHSHITSIGF